MRNSKKALIIAAAMAAAVPAASKAAVFTLTYDSNDFQVSTDGGNTFTPVVIGGTAAAPSVTIPVGAILEIGVDAEVQSNPNTSTAYNTSKGTQPNTLGIAAAGVSFTTLNGATASMDPSQTQISPDFVNITSNGISDTLGGISVASPVGGGNLGSQVNSSTTGGVATLSFGANAPVEIFNSLWVDGLKAGTATFTPVTAGDDGYFIYASGGTSSTNRPSYTNVTAVSGVDTINNLPALTVIVGSSTGPTGPTSGHSIVQLNSSSPAAASYGGTLATIVVTHLANNGGIVAGYDRITNTGTAVVSGIQPVTGFTATDTPQEFALDLVLPTGGSPTAAQLQTIISDINSASSTDGVVASLIPLNFQGVFSPSKGYDLMLTSTTSDTTPFLGFDFSQETNVAGITVAAVAAVPEPATAVGLLVGAGSLLLGRRKNRVA